MLYVASSILVADFNVTACGDKALAESITKLIHNRSANKRCPICIKIGIWVSKVRAPKKNCTMASHDNIFDQRTICPSWADLRLSQSAAKTRNMIVAIEISG